MLTGKCFIAH